MASEDVGRISRRAVLALALAVTGAGCDTDIQGATEPGAANNQRTGSWYGDFGKGEVRYDFDAAGHWVFSYQTRSEGKKSVALARVGQEVAFVPPEGGVSRITVTALDATATRMALDLTETFKRASNGISDDVRFDIHWEFENVPAGLAITVLETSTSRVGNQDGTLPPVTETSRSQATFVRR